MTTPLAFCTQCGPLHMEDDADGRAVSPIDEDGCCRFCGADTCSWEQLGELLGAAGFVTATRHERAVLDAAAKMRLIREKSSRPPFAESVVCRGGGKLLVDAEWARREAESK